MIIIFISACQNDTDKYINSVLDSDNNPELSTEIMTSDCISQNETQMQQSLSATEVDVALYEVATNQKEFISVNEGMQRFILSDYNFISGSVFDLSNLQIKYLITDLDCDEENEMIFIFGSGAMEMIFDYQGDAVYGYQVPYRSMKVITAEGICSCSGSASSFGKYKIKFDKETIKRNYIFYNIEDYYWVEGNNVSEDDYRDYVANFLEDQTLMFNDFSIENIVASLNIDVDSFQSTLNDEYYSLRYLNENVVPQNYVNAINGQESFEICIDGAIHDCKIVNGELVVDETDSKGKILYANVVDLNEDSVPEMVLYLDVLDDVVYLYSNSDKCFAFYDNAFYFKTIMADGTIATKNEVDWFEAEENFNQMYSANRLEIFIESKLSISFNEITDSSQEIAEFYIFSR